MHTINTSRPPVPPATTAAAEATAIQGQVLEHATVQKDAVAGTVEVEGNDTKTPMKAADAGLRNYFVSAL